MRVYFIPAIALGVVSFILFRLLYLRTSSKIVRVLLILVATALSTPAVFFTSNYALLIPCGDWFFEFRTLPGTETASGLIGSILGVMFASDKLRPARLNTPILMVCSVLSVMLLAAPFVRQLYNWMDYSLLTNKWEDGICLQTSGYTCLPACAATMIRMQNGNVTEAELARNAGTCMSGTETWYLIRALRKMGYEPKFQTLKSVKDAPVPSILCVVLTGVPHVVVLLHKDKEGVVIGEPMSGKKEYSWKVFRKCYRPSNSCILIQPIKHKP